MSVQTRTTALQNEIVRLEFVFQQNGLLTSPNGQPLVEILDTDGVTVLDVLSPTAESPGIFFVDWFIPADLPVGDYYDRWTYQFGPVTGVREDVNIFNVSSLDSYINFVSTGVSHNITSRAVQLLRDLSNDFIFEAQHIPVYWEQAMRIQQENVARRVKDYYFFTLDSSDVSLEKETIYENNGHFFTVFEFSVEPLNSSSSSSSLDSSSSSSSLDSSSSSSLDSSSSSSLDSSSSSSNSSDSSISSESATNVSSSSSSGIGTTTTTTTPVYSPEVIVTMVGTGDPTDSGVLTKTRGNGSDVLTFTEVEKKKSRFSTRYDLVYNNWIKDPKPVVRVNDRIVSDGWYTDFNGKIYFDRVMAPEDSVNVHYKFAYFSDEELLSFLRFGLEMMNGVPPASITFRSFENMPGEWNPGVLLYAAILALKRLIFGFTFQERAIIFGQDPQAAKDAIAVYQSLYQEYSETWTKYSTDVKSKKIYGMSQFVTPEYTLPGGRCMSSDTYINCKVDGKEKGLSIENLFELFERDMLIEVLSMTGDDQINYSFVSKIWKSGKKLTYIIKTEENKIRLSEEHLVYMPDEEIYKPVKEIKKDDNILVLQDHSLVKEKLISNPELYEIEDVYDIEVPETENFIGNNIISHNSRWFRYLFKTNQGG